MQEPTGTARGRAQDLSCDAPRGLVNVKDKNSIVLFFCTAAAAATRRGHGHRARDATS